MRVCIPGRGSIRRHRLREMLVILHQYAATLFKHLLHPAHPRRGTYFCAHLNNQPLIAMKTKRKINGRGRGRRYQCILPRDNLPTDPKAALLEISKYIATLQTKGREIPIVRDEREVPKGYWQTAKWTDGLLWLGSEAERVANQV